MRTLFREAPRQFDPDGRGRTSISDLGSIELAADEQITFVGPQGSEYDVARKEWGYYATPSLNGRLPAKGLRPALVSNAASRYYLCLVEAGGEEAFAQYLEASDMRVVAWMDDTAVLDSLKLTLGAEQKR